ncbi:phycobiliprotein lyase [Planktothrix paucivesiculata]|uniref:Chromophore lyase CpcS/CpeS n=1 Tax=Planktothrix paucivesiculata PCC 9631 TaxID=671071 RepID=A0A7Z9E400_9CYAN|nr:phycobiliprotein lyase [Planktothrix paucivesiculata]VXD22106.1 putative phycocyanobilin lyase CpcS 2 [Planktothrix paucivesiculata PCC 9631]
MKALIQQNPREIASQVADYFCRSVGNWHSERRYYTLPEGDTQEVASEIIVEFLEPGCPDLLDIAQLHQLDDPMLLSCGSKVTWKSCNSVSGKKMSTGSTRFGVCDTWLYRDRGFMTPKPVVAEFYMLDVNTLCLRSEYNGSMFEEEIKLIGQRYRTRQTIISRAGEQTMIGQYLEKRIE